MKAGRCAVTDTWQGYSEGMFGMTTYGSVNQCSGLRQQDGGLLFSACGRFGDLSLPPRPPEQFGHVCGILLDENHAVSSSPVTQDTESGIEDCFWKAYVSCARPATLIYNNDFRSPEPEASGGYEDHTLVVQPSRSSCALTDVVAASDQSSGKYTCASLSRTTDGGLVARACGKEGDVIIPPAPPNQNQ